MFVKRRMFYLFIYSSTDLQILQITNKLQFKIYTLNY